MQLTKDEFILVLYALSTFFFCLISWRLWFLDCVLSNSKECVERKTCVIRPCSSALLNCHFLILISGIVLDTTIFNLSEGQVKSLLELCSQSVAMHIPFEQVEKMHLPVPEEVQLKIAFWSFPSNEEDIRLVFLHNS